MQRPIKKKDPSKGKKWKKKKKLIKSFEENEKKTKKKHNGSNGALNRALKAANELLVVRTSID